MGSMKVGVFHPAFRAAAILAILALSSLLQASQGASSPISVQLDNNFQQPNDDRFFRTDVYGTPTLSLSTSSSNIVLSPPGAQKNDLPPNAILCPGPLNATMGGADIRWAHTYFNGSSSFPSVRGRSVLPQISGSNPVTTDIPIVINSAMASELDTSPLSTYHYVRRADANNIWNRLDAATVSDQNVRYLLQIGPLSPCALPYCQPSNASKTSIVCRGKAIINSVEYDLTATDTSILLGSSYSAGQSANVNAQMRLDKCIGVIHALPDNVPSGTSDSDRIYLFALAQTITFPSSSGTASLSVQFKDPRPDARVIGTYGPYQLNSGQSTTISVQVENNASSTLPFNVTGVSFRSGTSHGSMSVTLVSGAIIQPGQIGTVQVRITQGSPPYNGNIDLDITGQSVGMACNGSLMGFAAPLTNIAISNGDSCALSPNPVYLGAGSTTVSATCTRISGGVPTSIQCPAFSWTNSAQNTSTSPTSTPSGYNPSVSVSYSGTVSPGGTISASGGGMNCSAPISCGPMTCVLASNTSTSPGSAIVVPPASARINATCSITNTNVMCPAFSWSSNLTGVSANPTSTSASMSPQVTLYTYTSTPQQSGYIRADSSGFCSNVNCILNTTISSALCRMPCKVNSPMAGVMLYSGLNVYSYAECNDTVMGRSYVTCPTGDWASDAGAMSPTRTSPSTSPSSTLLVTNISGTFIKFNYTDNYGGNCSCNLSLRSALPDYVPQLLALSPAGIIPIGGTAGILIATKNNGTASAVNTTNTTILFPGGTTNYYSVPPLAVNATYPIGGQAYSFVCSSAGLKNATIIVDSGLTQAEADETNNQLNVSINCGGVLLCADYI